MLRSVVYISVFFVTLSPGLPDSNSDMVKFLREYLSVRYAKKSFDQFIYVAAKKQVLYVIEENNIEAQYSISTARKGLGNSEGSFQTPTGLHQIVEKIGADVEIFGIIKQKVPTGEMVSPILDKKATNQDLITTRILHLSGMEKGLNKGEGVDSYKRGIFIHGTHEEGLIGTPASKGCIRMKNTEVIDLFERVEVGTFVVILNN
ncbi:MAG: L,D-transpeptidase [Flavobacteriales bacterium]|nr:L,D-transpeptidase [Flavobacteriales bacterium]